MHSGLARLGMLLVLLTSASIGLGAACNNSGNARHNAPPRVRPDPARAGLGAPSLRIYYLVDLDGYLEPCGCQSRPLGGVDRLASLLRAERSAAPNSLLVASGNLFFDRPRLDARMVYQEGAKAETIARVLDQIGLSAFAPGPADFARGADEWRRLIQMGHFAPLAANVEGVASLERAAVRDVGGIRVGIVGVSDFRENSEAQPPEGAPSTTDPVAAARAGVESVRGQGAQVVLVLASTPRRVARAIAQQIRGVHFVIAAREESNEPSPPERLGNAYLMTAPNQGKAVGIIDVYRRGEGDLYVDVSEATSVAEQRRLQRLIDELRVQIAAWERDPSTDRAALAQQRARLERLERQRAAVAVPPLPPAHGSYFRARVVMIDPDLPKREDIEHSIAQYFRTVNEHNREAYADLRAPPAPPGTARYIGSEQCRDCHEEAYEIWIRTPHSRAYHTLEVISKNYNLSCVGCHVTGYQRPGGSEVVQNEGLRDVQCESCHGPGSLHAEARGAAQRRATIQREVPASFCAGNCHTPEHSDHFDYATYLPRILGPGHGHPLDSDAGVQLSAPVIAGGASPDGGAGATDAHATPVTAAGAAH